MTAEITLTPKIQTVEAAAAEIKDFARNPPQTPGEAVYRFANMVGVSGSVSAALNMVVPFAGPAITMLSDLFLGLGSGPSMGEITLKAIGELSRQLSDVARILDERISAKVTEQAQRTIDVVLSGVDEIAREQSAVSVFRELNRMSVQEALRAEREQIYNTYLQQLNQLREQKLLEITTALEAARAKVQAQYDAAMARALQIIGQVLPLLEATLSDYLRQQQADGITARSVQERQDNATGGGSSTGLILAGLAVGGIALYATRKKN